MKFNFIEKNDNKVKFEMVFTPEEFEEAIVEAYKKNKDKYRIDGFRQGKAPRKIIENHYGEGVFYDDAINDMLAVGYPNALTELDIEAVDSPMIELKEINKGDDIVVTATVESFPEIELGQYKGLEIERIDYTIGDDEINAELEKVRKSQARMDTVTDRPSESGDTVIIDFDGSVDGERFAGGVAENYGLKLGSGQFIPGFEDQLIGKNAEDEVDVVVTFPEDYHAPDLAGKEAVFKTKIHEVKKETLPEIDDELASDVSDFETLEEYKKDIAEKLQKQSDEMAESYMKDAALQELYKVNEISVPNAMIESEIDNVVREMEQQLAYQGLTLDKYMGYLGKTMEDIRNESREEAERRVAMRIILRAICEAEAIEASEEEVQKELEEFAAQYGSDVENIKKMIGDENLKYFGEDVKTKKAIDLVYNEAVKVEPKKNDEEK